MLCAFAAPAMAGWSTDDLARALKAPHPEKIAFTERREIVYLDAPIIAEGWMRIEGDVLFKHVREPAPETFEIHANELVRKDEDGAVTRIGINDYPALRGMITAMRAVLNGELEPLATQFDLALSGDEAAWVLTLTPKSEPLANHLKRIGIEGSGGDTRRIAVDQRNGDKTVIELRYD